MYSTLLEESPRSSSSEASHRAPEVSQRLAPLRHILLDEATQLAYAQCATGNGTPPLAVVGPTNLAEVREVVAVAHQHGMPLYPISTGRNWGYGSACPVQPGCLLVDLSRMDRIVDFDSDLGIVTVEPGVTQRKLREFLDENAPGFLVPVHGGGPECSLVGNALERGYGITPNTDHFGAVTSLEAVLADGTIYRSAHHALGGELVDKAFKWGIGPYLDGLFTQSNFGIVTKATIALARVPERTEAFFFWVKRDADLERAVSAVREVLRTAGGVVGSVNLMNARRVLAMTVPYPRDEVPAGAIMTDELVQRLARKNRIPAWMGVGTIYGSRGVIKAIRKSIRRELRPVASRLRFATPGFVRAVRRGLARLPRRGGERVWRIVDTIHKSLQLVAGAPSEVALPLAYWKSGTQPTDGSPKNPARDGCGLMWYSPLVPMKPGIVRDYVKMTEATCIANGIEPLITLTSLSERCFDSTVPILFDRECADEASRAAVCYESLFRGGQEMGCLPYRVGTRHMDMVIDPAAPAWQLAARIKDAVDPQRIMAPGRYSVH